MLPGTTSGEATAAKSGSSMPHPMYVAYNNSLQAQRNRSKQYQYQAAVHEPPPPPPPPVQRQTPGSSPDNGTAGGSATQVMLEEPGACNPTVRVIPWMQAVTCAAGNPQELAVYTTAEVAAAAATAATPATASTSATRAPTVGGTVLEQQQYHVAGSDASSYCSSSSKIIISTSSQLQPHQLRPNAGQQQQQPAAVTITAPGAGAAFTGAVPPMMSSAPVLHSVPVPASPFSTVAGASNSSSASHHQLFAPPATDHQQQQQMVMLGLQQHSGSLDSSQSSNMGVMPFQLGSNSMLQRLYSPSSTLDLGSGHSGQLQNQLAGGTAATQGPGQHVAASPNSSANSPGFPAVAEQHNFPHQPQQQQQQAQAHSCPSDALRAIDLQLANLLLLRQQMSDTPQTVGPSVGHTATAVIASCGLADQATVLPLQHGSTAMTSQQYCSTAAPLQQYCTIEGSTSMTGSTSFAGPSQVTFMSAPLPMVMLTQQQQQQQQPVAYQQQLLMLQPHQQQQQQQPVMLLAQTPGVAAGPSVAAAAAAAPSGMHVVGLTAEQVQARLQELHEAQITRQQLRAELMRLLPM